MTSLSCEKQPNEFIDSYGLKAGELRLLRAKDVCAILSISRQQLYRMRISGAFLTPVRISERVVAYRSDDLLAWMNRCKPVDEIKEGTSQPRPVPSEQILQPENAAST